MKIKPRKLQITITVNVGEFYSEGQTQKEWEKNDLQAMKGYLREKIFSVLPGSIQCRS